MLRLLTLVLVLTSCRTTTSSGVRDAELSPRNVSHPSNLVWQTNDNVVHYGNCPAGTVPVNRKCSGLQEKASVSIDTYKTKLTAAIIEDRSQTGGTATLSVEEQKTFDAILNSLLEGNDVTFDDGEQKFYFAEAAFVERSRYLAYRLVVTEAMSGGCSGTFGLRALKFKIGGQFESFTLSSSTAPNLEGQFTVKGDAVVAKVSSNWGPQYGVPSAFDTSSATEKMWYAASCVDANTGKITSLQYLEIRFTSPQQVLGAQFGSAPNNAPCLPKNFHMEGSRDGTNFSPIPNASWNNIADKGGIVQSFEWQ